MKNVIIYSDQLKGHLIPTFYIAKQLESEGYKVFYIGVKQTISEVKKLGFSSYEIFKDRGLQQNYNPLKMILDGELDEIINEIQPKFILSTPFDVLETLLFYYKYNIQMIFVWSHFPENETNTGSSRYTKFIRNKVGDTFLESSNAENFFLFTDYMDGLGYKTNTLDDVVAPLKKSGHFITLSKELLIRPDAYLYNEVYLGPCIFDRSIFDEENSFIKNEMKFLQLHLDNREIIYCSMGTGSTRSDYSNKSILNLNKIIRCAASVTLKDYQFVIACGNVIDSLKELNCPENVHLFKWVPQVKILKYSSLAYIHGGMGSIKECIMEAVPMLITPVGRDQFLNAELISYHNLGIKLDIDNESDEQLVSIIKNTLQDEKIKESINTMKNIFDRDTKQKRGLQYINELLNVEIV